MLQRRRSNRVANALCLNMHTNEPESHMVRGMVTGVRRPTLRQSPRLCHARGVPKHAWRSPLASTASRRRTHREGGTCPRQACDAPIRVHECPDPPNMIHRRRVVYHEHVATNDARSAVPGAVCQTWRGVVHPARGAESRQLARLTTASRSGGMRCGSDSRRRADNVSRMASPGL